MKKLTVKENLTPSQKVEKLIELQALERKIKPQIDKLKGELLEAMKSQDLEMMRTGSYTLSRAKRVTPKVVDFEAVKKYLDKNDIPYETKEVFEDYMTNTFKYLVEEGKEVEGLDTQETEYVSVRIKE